MIEQQPTFTLKCRRPLLGLGSPFFFRVAVVEAAAAEVVVVVVVIPVISLRYTKYKHILVGERSK